MIRTIARRFAPAASSAALVLTVTQPAFAAPAPVEEEVVDLPAGVACAFPLRLEASAGKVTVVEFEGENGNPVRTIRVATGVVLTYTNLDTDESVSFKTSGSVTKTETNEDGTQTVTATGHNGLILFPSDVPAGPSTRQVSGGRLVYTIDPTTGVFTLLSVRGNATDVCAELS